MSLLFKLNTFLNGFLLFTSISAWAHPGQRVEIELENQIFTAGKNTLSFTLFDEKNKKFLAPDDLNITHEKILHFIVYDEALIEFRHLHPEYDEKNELWTTEVELPVDGKYFVWAQGELKDKNTEFSAPSDFKIEKGSKANPLPPALDDSREGASSGTKVTLSKQTIHEKKMVMLDLFVTRADGSTPKLEPYLGAPAHVVAVSSDAKSQVHVHPMDTSDPNKMMLHTEFPKKGFYRLWVQLIDDGKLLVIPLSVEVKQ